MGEKSGVEHISKQIQFAPHAWDENEFLYNPPIDTEFSENSNEPAIEGHMNWKFSHCAICFNDMKEPCILECGHFFCLPCLEHYLRVSMDSGTVDLLACPDLSCGKLLSDFDVSCILPTEEYNRFRNITSNCNSYTKRKQDEVWCPLLDCS